VDNDFDNLAKLGLKVVTAELVGDTAHTPKIRHNPEALAEVVIDLASRSRAYQVRKKALAAQRTGFR
jgi:hypothetical protein